MAFGTFGAGLPLSRGGQPKKHEGGGAVAVAGGPGDVNADAPDARSFDAVRPRRSLLRGVVSKAFDTGSTPSSK